MKPSMFLNAIQKAIEKRDPIVETPFDIIIRAGELICQKSKNLQPADTMIVKVTHLHISQGFSSTEWEKMFSRMNAYFSRTK